MMLPVIVLCKGRSDFLPFVQAFAIFLAETERLKPLNHVSSEGPQAALEHVIYFLFVL